ncbi:hypothetical protein [Paraburkholderia sp. BCC1885]|uniref:hypothetical protein n=1 Tax=Paraburkholderia sp. BCC1885 TaxID=2562669 RepID=UPI001183A239|nr:hypothetical protein [Paraburkholderia sp. BCC1885]
MNRTFLAAVPAASASIASAQSLSEQDINLMATAQKAVKTYTNDAMQLGRGTQKMKLIERATQWLRQRTDSLGRLRVSSPTVPYAQ